MDSPLKSAFFSKSKIAVVTDSGTRVPWVEFKTSFMENPGIA